MNEVYICTLLRIVVFLRMSTLFANFSFLPIVGCCLKKKIPCLQQRQQNTHRKHQRRQRQQQCCLFGDYCGKIKKMFGFFCHLVHDSFFHLYRIQWSAKDMGLVYRPCNRNHCNDFVGRIYMFKKGIRRYTFIAIVRGSKANNIQEIHRSRGEIIVFFSICSL